MVSGNPFQFDNCPQCGLLSFVHDVKTDMHKCNNDECEHECTHEEYEKNKRNQQERGTE